VQAVRQCGEKKVRASSTEAAAAEKTREKRNSASFLRKPQSIASLPLFRERPAARESGEEGGEEGEGERRGLSKRIGRREEG